MLHSSCLGSLCTSTTSIYRYPALLSQQLLCEPKLSPDPPELERAKLKLASDIPAAEYHTLVYI